MYSGGFTPFESLEEHWAYEKTYDNEKQIRARQKYRLMSTFEMDARYKGFSEGLKQKSIETAKLMKNRGYPISEILLMTGFSKMEILHYLCFKLNTLSRF